ncbi:PAS domain S-box protein [Halapricum sp. CBA1109]|uniref:sensor histidine kinase n=1 Tax=Halapricum sp. CBA1109 TaxID=2668068 RepID=UPI0012F7393C|nr:PAS domain-containing sensor histidine kinase [Halapricum sp. CBA1109]MUV88740.1 PAS domain S-box protein [Halapricum sp. CBA1109]
MREDPAGTPTTVPAHVLDADGHLRFVNDAWVAFTGYDRESVLGDPFGAVLTEGSSARLQTQLAGDELAARTLFVRRADDEAVPVVHDGAAEQAADGTRYHCQCRPESSADSTETTALLRALVDGLPVGVLAETTGREVLAVNDPLLSMFDADGTPADVVGADCAELAAESADQFVDPEGFLDGIESAIDGGEPVACERLVREDGRVFERSYFPVSLPAGPGHLWIYDDVTERSQREADLRTYERLFEVAPVGVFRTTTGGSVLSVNPKMASILGYEDVDTLLSSYDDLATELYTDPGSRETFLDRLESVGLVEDFVYQAIDADGERIWLSMNARLLPETVDGEQVITGFTRDVTERRTRERDLRTYREIVERLRDPIMLQDCTGQYVLANEALASYTDRSPAELVGVDERAVLDATTAAEIDRIKKRVLRTEQPVEATIRPTFDGGGTRSFTTLRFPYYDTAGELAGTVALWRDVTDQQQREQQLAVLGRILRHNLRNAMTVVQGQAEMIAAGTAADPAAAATTILDRIDELMALVNKEQTVTTVLRESTGRRARDVTALLRSAVESTRTRFQSATVEMSAPDCARALVCDRFERALIELLDNAFRHTDTDTVAAEVSVADDHVVVSIRDRGPGMATIERDVLRGEANITPLSHSTGVGLWLVQWLVNLSDGTVSVADNDPTGTVVTVRVPRADGGNDFEGVR